VNNINTIQLLQNQLKWAHEEMEMTMADVTDDVAQYDEVGMALSVAAAYAHAVVAEDMIVASMLAHKAPLSQREETGLSIPMPAQEHWDQHAEWAKNVKVDLTKLHAFAKKVYLATDEWIVTVKEEDLEQEIDMGQMGKQTVAWLITNFLILHIANLCGEISAIKGVQGLKGYPF